MVDPGPYKQSCQKLAAKSAAIEAQDAMWLDGMPRGWHHVIDYAVSWGLTVKTSLYRLSMLVAAGAVEYRQKSKQYRPNRKEWRRK